MIEKQILSNLIDKLTNKCIHKPELYIYNTLIDQKNENLLCIFNHFTLPLSRKTVHPLYAVFFFFYKLFCIIEYDGLHIMI